MHQPIKNLYNEEDLKISHEWRLRRYNEFLDGFKKYLDKILEIRDRLESIHQNEIPFDNGLPIYHEHDLWMIWQCNDIPDLINYYEESEERYERVLSGGELTTEEDCR